MENIKVEGYYPAHILSLKKDSIVLQQSDCVDAGGDWSASVHFLLNEGWSIDEVKKEIEKE